MSVLLRGPVFQLCILSMIITDVKSTSCPLDHPYAYHGGAYCCLYNKEKPAYEHRPNYFSSNCDGGNITITSECCQFDEFISCPGTTCVTESIVSGPCTEEFPYPYYNGLYCCKDNKEKLQFEKRNNQSSACDNGVLSLESLCCNNDNFVQCDNPPCAAMSWWSLTWLAEGNDDPNSDNFSRKLRLPMTGYGLTIGRGYDMQLIYDLTASAQMVEAGLSQDKADTISQGEGLTGSEATQYITDNDLLNFTITHQQQWKLFKIQRDYQITAAKTLFNRADIVAFYGATDFETIHSSIRGLVIDLLFRYEYTSSTRAFLQPKIVLNDVVGLKTLMSTSSLWAYTPQDRFDRRKAYMEKAAASL